jgi:hypothetical protein
LIALRTFIPLVCCFWRKTATPLCCVLAATAPAAVVHPVLTVVLGERMACEQHRVCIEGRAAAAGRDDERERRRIDEESDLDADAVDRTALVRIGRLAIDAAAAAAG